MQPSSSSTPWILAVLITLVLLCFGEAVRSYPAIKGDGKEYLAYLHNMALGNGVNIVDVSLLKSRHQSYLSKLREGVDVRDIGTGTRVRYFIMDNEGKVYTWHWWGYSAFSLPAYLLLRSFGLPGVGAFTATNFAFLALLLVYLARFSHQSVSFRTLFACLFMLSGTSFYLWWSHPEVMSASLTALGLVAWLDRRNILSVTVIAIAATQNPPLALLILVPGISVVSGLVTAYRSKIDRVSSTLELVKAGIAGAIAFIPSVWYLQKLGVANPIVSGGMAKFRPENFWKSLDLFFDLNQGMILLQIISFLIIGSYIVFNVFRWHAMDEERRRLVFLVCGFLFITYVMSVLAAASTNWNPGITVISRYSYWLSVPVILAVCLIVESRALAPLRQLVSLGLVFGGVLLVSLWGFHGKDYNFETFTRPSLIAMRLMPSNYFPHPKIFCYRAQEKPKCKFDRPYVVQRPGFPPTRVLVAESFLKRQCQGELPVESPTKRERLGRKSLLWFSGTVTCPSGLRVDTVISEDE